MRILILFIAMQLCLGVTFAEVGRVTGLPVPRFVSFKSKVTNVRAGPSNQHSVKWIYHQKGYPVKIVAEFEHWRKINDIDGEDGWVHEAMLSGARHVVVIKNSLTGELAAKQPAKELFILRKPAITSHPIARVQLGVTCSLKQCKTDWCEISCSGQRGWTSRGNIWGITAADTNVKFK